MHASKLQKHFRGARRQARICALQVQYALDVLPQSSNEALRYYRTGFIDPLYTLHELLGPMDDQTRADQEEKHDELFEFTERLIEGIEDNKEHLDELIQSSSRNWKLSRMAIVDRNILRIAAFELTELPDIPKRVSINEAIELGKLFGSQDSGSFINGVLDKISQGVGKE